MSMEHWCNDTDRGISKQSEKICHSAVCLPQVTYWEYYTDGRCLWYLVLWFSSCRYDVELKVMCPVCRLLLKQLLMMGIVLSETCWACNKICNKSSSVASSWRFISTYVYGSLHMWRIQRYINASLMFWRYEFPIPYATICLEYYLYISSFPPKRWSDLSYFQIYRHRYICLGY